MSPRQSPPDSFLGLSEWFHQDIQHQYPRLEGAASGYIATLNAAAADELRAYLTDLLASDASDGELRELWSECGSQWGIVPIRPFLERVRAELASRTK
jgi:hypothetical protein